MEYRNSKCREQLLPPTLGLRDIIQGRNKLERDPTPIQDWDFDTIGEGLPVAHWIAKIPGVP